MFISDIDQKTLDPQILKVVNKISKKCNLIEKYMIWVESLNFDDANIIIINQINNVLKNIKKVSKIQSNVTKYYDEYMINYQQAFIKLSEPKEYNSFFENLVIDSILSTHIKYKTYEKHMNLNQLSIIYAQIFQQIKHLFYVIVFIFYQNVTVYNDENLYNINEFLTYVEKILTDFNNQYQNIKKINLTKNEVKILDEYFSIYKQFIKIILNILSHKILTLENIANNQKVYVLGKTKAILSTNKQEQNRLIFFFIIDIFQNNSYITKYIETQNVDNLEINSSNVLINKLINEFYNTSSNDIKNYIIISIIYLKIKVYINQINKHFSIIIKFLDIL